MGGETYRGCVNSMVLMGSGGIILSVKLKGGLKIWALPDFINNGDLR